ncbi:hypothetical protein [Zavarzinella formosa]|uniref:hypothetical protein n=1 Tax=Zavarzinella formosa TaxID=360055 RepID=UPI00038269E9|nr:hypothetical protein [Zavarzinella formosa]
MAPRLRLYTGHDEEETFLPPVAPPPPVHIRLRDLIPLVAMAQKNHFIWLKDFLDDEVSISDDLHDVLMAFRSTRPA